ncbi:hypothetical protein ACFQ9V_14155 [Leifsonia sp. NPDC056665]|uniref:hypothetical protein n=1 Tax=Leifsonia sp. NPDC056665 TaxID=3345901 RepID=UPI003679EDEB
MSWLADLIDDAAKDVSNTVDSTIHAIDDAVHQAARRLLDAALPPMVHTEYAVVKSANWVVIEGAVTAVNVTLQSADVAAALSGAVEKKVTTGLERIAANNDYARAVESITP